MGSRRLALTILPALVSTGCAFFDLASETIDDVECVTTIMNLDLEISATTEDVCRSDTCLVLEGDLLIAADRATALPDLSCVVAVNGDLWSRSQSLPSLEGLETIARIGGSLVLPPDSSFDDLRGLDGLTSVGGSIVIPRGFRSLAGLEALEEVGGDLEISWMPLVDVSELRSLRAVGGDLILRRLDELVEISLPSLELVGGLDVQWNPALRRIDLGRLTVTHRIGLQNLAALEEIVGSPTLGTPDFVDVRFAPALRSVVPLGLTSAEHVLIQDTALTDATLLTGLVEAEYLRLDDNNAMTGVDGLESLTSAGILSLYGNDTLASLDGLAGLEEVRRDLEIAHNAIESLVGLRGLRRIGGGFDLMQYYPPMVLEGPPALEEIGDWFEVIADLVAVQGPDSLERVGGGLFLYDVAGDVSGFAGLTEIAGTLQIGAAGTVDGFDSLTSVGRLYLEGHGDDEALDVRGFPLLESVESLTLRHAAAPVSTGLPLLANVDQRLALDDLGSVDGLGGIERVGDILWIHGLGDVDLSALSGLVELGGLTVQGCDDLTSLGTMSVPADLPLGLAITDNAHLVDIEALATVRTTTSVRILENNFLPSIEALHGIESVEGDLTVWDNPYLPDAAVQDFLDAVGLDAIGGDVVVGNNGG